MAIWSELPLELLELIGNRVESSSDARRFRAVCSSWRYSLTKLAPLQTPSQFPYMKYLSLQVYHCDLRLVKRTIYCLSLPSKQNSGWLIMTEEHKPGLFHLCSPFSKEISKKHKRILDITSIDVKELAHEYVLRNVIRGDLHLYNMENEKVALIDFTSSKSQSQVSASAPEYILLSTHRTSGKLLIYRSIVKEWAFLEDDTLGYNNRSSFSKPVCYVDVVAYEGSFFAVTDYGTTIVMKVSQDSSITCTVLTKSMIGGDKKCLVKSVDDLLLIDLYTCPISSGLFELNAVDVYKLDETGQKWVLLNSLGDWSIFLSNDSSFCVSGVKGLQQNCIYFYFGNLDDNKDVDYKNEGCGNGDCLNCDEHEIGVFDYEKGIFGTLKEKLQDTVTFFHWPEPTCTSQICIYTT